MSKILLTLTRADAGKLQDAWHYAMLILKRSQSTFDGDNDYPDGIRGELKAYENLLAKLEQMSRDNETWELVKSKWWNPSTTSEMRDYVASALLAVNAAAQRLGIDARTCGPIGYAATARPWNVTEDDNGLYIVGDTTVEVATVNTKADAELIVKAVNNYRS